MTRQDEQEPFAEPGGQYVFPGMERKEDYKAKPTVVVYGRGHVIDLGVVTDTTLHYREVGL